MSVRLPVVISAVACQLWMVSASPQDDTQGPQMVRYQSPKYCNVSDSGGNIYNVTCASLGGSGDKTTTNTKPSPGVGGRGSKEHSETEIKYGLVPAFLIGASSVIVIYIVSHCLYVHCYAKRKLKRMTRENEQATQDKNRARSLSHTSAHYHDRTSAFSPVNPTVKYNHHRQRTEIQNTPVVHCPQPKRGSDSHCKNQPHVRSPAVGFTLLTPSTPRKDPIGQETGETKYVPIQTPDGAQKTSICFVPIAGQESGSAKEWAPVQGYLYSAMLVSGDQVDGQQCDVNGLVAGDPSSSPHLSTSRILLVPSPIPSEAGVSTDVSVVTLPNNHMPSAAHNTPGNGEPISAGTVHTQAMVHIR